MSELKADQQRAASCTKTLDSYLPLRIPVHRGRVCHDSPSLRSIRSPLSRPGRSYGSRTRSARSVGWVGSCSRMLVTQERWARSAQSAPSVSLGGHLAGTPETQLFSSLSCPRRLSTTTRRTRGICYACARRCTGTCTRPDCAGRNVWCSCTASSSLD